MKVKLNDLLIVTKKIISHLEENGINEIELDKDFYWSIPKEELYEVNKNPVDLDIGQLYDDMEFLDNILKDKNDPIGFALVWLSSIFRYIGEMNVQ